MHFHIVRRFLSSSSSSSSPPLEVIKAKIRSMVVKKPQPPIKKFNQFLHPLMKENEFGKALSVGKYLIYDNKCYDEFTVNVMMNALCRLGFVGNAMSSLSLFVKCGLTIDTVSVTTLLKGYAISHPSKGLQFVNHLTTKNIPVQFNDMTLGTLLHCFCLYDLDGVRKAEKIIHEIEKGTYEGIKSNVVMYGTVIHGFCKNGDPDSALKLYHKMKSQGIKPNCYIVSSFIHCYCFTDDSDNALRFLADSLFVGKVRLDIISLGSIVDSLAKNGMISVCLALIPVMLKQGFHPNLIILHTLMEGFNVVHQYDKCIKLLGLLGNAANLISYTIVVDGLMTASRVEEAISYFHLMCSKGISPDQIILTTVINGYVNTGRSRLALAFMDKHQETLSEATTVMTYTVMIRAYLRANKLDKAHQLLTDMKVRELEPNSITYHVIIDELFRLDCFNGAKAAFYHALLNHSHVSLLPFNAFIAGLCSNGFTDEANCLLKFMDNRNGYHNWPAPNSSTYYLLIKALFRLDKHKEALVLLEEFLVKLENGSLKTEASLLEKEFMKWYKKELCGKNAHLVLGKVTEKLAKMFERNCDRELSGNSKQKSPGGSIQINYYEGSITGLRSKEKYDDDFGEYKE